MIAAGRIPADAQDVEGETIGGIGSAVEVVPGGVVMLSDRGPGDGTMDYRPRLQFFGLGRDGGKLNLSLERTLILQDSSGRAFTGLFPELPPELPPQRSDGRMCLDPEGLAIGPKGNFFVSEEYLPSVREFDAQGRFVRRFEAPDEVVPRGASGVNVATDEADALTSGRQPNRGFEGLAMLPDGQLAAVLQSGLTQDGGRKAGFTKLYLFDPARGRATAAYRVDFPDAAEIDAASPAGKKLEAKHFVISALAALPDGRLLALERENFGADGSSKHGPARWKAVVLLDLSGAGNMLEGGSTPVRRTALFNLAALDTASSGLPREELPAKWEGLAVAGIEGDQVRLLLSSDNDFLTPRLHLRDESGAAREVEFPRAERAQDTWILEVETTLPPVAPSTPRNT